MSLSAWCLSSLSHTRDSAKSCGETASWVACPGSVSVSLHQHRPALCTGPPVAGGIAVEGRALGSDGKKGRPRNQSGKVTCCIDGSASARI